MRLWHVQEMLSRLRANHGLWYDLAEYIPALLSSGFDAAMIENESGLERPRQNVWVVSAQVRDWCAHAPRTWPPWASRCWSLGRPAACRPLRSQMAASVSRVPQPWAPAKKLHPALHSCTQLCTLPALKRGQHTCDPCPARLQMEGRVSLTRAPSQRPASRPAGWAGARLAAEVGGGGRRRPQVL